MKIAIYFAFINILTFVLFAVDKIKAEHDLWRIPEKSLLIMCAIGGSLGGYAGMRIFHHKTRKPLFRYGVPVIFLLQVVLGTILFVK